MNYLNNPDVKKAALIIIGNEILSGRTLDKNTQWIADQCVAHGIALIEVRIVPDVEAVVVRTLHQMRDDVDYVFTTGGIGPTHDDITAACVAKAFDVDLVLNDAAYEMLVAHYGDPAEVTEARKKMAMIPQGASLIPNAVSGAPGFVIGNVHVMAGVPRIMHNMFDHLLAHVLNAGKKVFSNNLMCSRPESEMAPLLGAVQEVHEDVDIGSYPHYRDGHPSVSIVLRSTEEESLKAATRAVLDMIARIDAVPDAMSFQVEID